jgi:hypothetical protein
MTPQFFNTAYGITNALQNVFPAPVVANRAPLTTDTGYQLGTIWIHKALNDAYVLTSVVSASATWLNMAGGGGSFSSLTVTPGPISLTGTTTINTTGSATTSIGSTTGASGITELVGTGNFSLDGVAGSTYTIGASTTTGTIAIGGTAQTGAITLGSSSGTNIVNLGTGAGATTVNIATGVTNAKTINVGTGAAMANTIAIGGTGANVVTIANTQTAGSIAIGTAMTTGTVSIGGTGLQTGNFDLAPGTGAQAITLGNGGTGIKTISIGTAAVANVITIGSTTASAATTIQAGSGTTGLSLSAGGNVQMAPAVNSVAGTTIVLNARVGGATFTGQTTAAAGILTLTITNAVVTAGSYILVSASNLGANDAKMTVSRVIPGTGTFDVILINNGAAALNGDVIVTFWVLN